MLPGVGQAWPSLSHHLSAPDEGLDSPPDDRCLGLEEAGTRHRRRIFSSTLTLGHSRLQSDAGKAEGQTVRPPARAGTPWPEAWSRADCGSGPS